MTDAPPPPNRELVTYVLGLLGGEFKRQNTEDIAQKCFELFPRSFSWVKYTQFPDKDLVRVALYDAQKEEYGSLVDGKYSSRDISKDGWILTDSGTEWFRENSDRIQGREGDSVAPSKHRQVARKKLQRILDHPVWQRYQEDPAAFSPSLVELSDLFRCRVDASERIWDKRLESAEKLARASQQIDLTDFLAKCRKAMAAGPTLKEEP